MTSTQPPRRRRSSKLTLSRLTDVVDHFGEAFVLWDADDRLVLCNRNYREFFALSADLMTPGNSFEEILRGAAARGQYVDAHVDPENWIQERLRRRRAAVGSFELELFDGRCLHVTNRRTSDGGIVGILSDITERKKGEMELRAANNRLKAAMEKLASSERLATIGQVAATVSHELRNPLGAIRNSMALIYQLTAGKQLGVERALERVDRNIERCTAIITALLEFTREKEITRASTALDAWLADLLAKYTAPEGIAIEHELQAGTEVAIDPEWFRHALIHLIDNGVQALQDPAWYPPPGHARRVAVRSERAGPHVRITLSDTGPGIPPDVLPRIFEPLFTTKGFGVGLGLPTVRQIVEKHGGTIDVDSSVGNGTTVTIWLPRRRDPQAAAHDAAA
jgi:signal transduction histidine kinase